MGERPRQQRLPHRLRGAGAGRGAARGLPVRHRDAGPRQDAPVAVLAGEPAGRAEQQQRPQPARL